MLITTVMLAFLLFKVWRWNRWLAVGTIGRAPNGKVDYKRLKGEAQERLGVG